MKTCKQLQAVVEALCTKHQVDLKQVGAHLRLENDPYEPLVIERIAEYQVSIAHYYVQNGDAIADPDVVIFTGYPEWVSICKFQFSDAASQSLRCSIAEFPMQTGDSPLQ